MTRRRIPARRGHELIDRRGYRYFCTSCGNDLARVQDAPMLHTEVWTKFANPQDFCAHCFFDGATDQF